MLLYFVLRIGLLELPQLAHDLAHLAVLDDALTTQSSLAQWTHRIGRSEDLLNALVTVRVATISQLGVLKLV
jgi:hypothetical protein